MGKFLRSMLLALAAVLLVALAGGCGGGGGTKEGGGVKEKGTAPQKWVFATNHEFSVRPDGLPALQDTYGFKFDEVKTMDLGVTYGALKDGLVPAAMGFATDGRIVAFDLVNLEDDKHFFPVYNPAPVVRKEVMDKYLELADILGKISPLLDTETMTKLNAQVDIDSKEPKDVAKKWLLEKGLLKEGQAPAQNKGKIVVGSKEFTEQLILGQITILALQNAGYQTVDRTGLGGTDIARKALENGEIDVYWEYTGTAWLVALKHEKPITDSEEAFQKVKEEDLAKHKLVWLPYAEFDNTYTIMMRKEDAEQLGIKSISDLARVINSSIG